MGGFWRDLLLFLHVLGAVASIGPTLTYGMWTYLADRRGPEHRSFVLDSVSWVDRHLATPAFMAQAATGVGLILVVGWDLLATAWLLSGVVLYAAMTALAVAVYAPTVRRHRAAAAVLAERPDDPAARAAYDAAGRASRAQGVAVTALTLVILWLMVTKPALWN